MMAKKISEREFIKSLMAKAGCRTNEEFGEMFGVTKSSVGLWMNGKSPIPLDRFLSRFGRETLDWVKQRYDLDEGPTPGRSGDIIRREAEKIQYLIDSGLITFPCREDCQRERKSPGDDRGEKWELSESSIVRVDGLSFGQPQ